MKTPEALAVLAALQKAVSARPAGRFVGGCVRDGLLGLAVQDIDIATPLPPEDAKRRLEKAGIRVIPTGLAHGTVTAHLNHHFFEITTLRADVETFGRHARVAYIDDWAEDARRRDFTMNALYADPDGTIFDPVNGLADLDAGVVRFIGEAEARIREDGLRILRYFRFFTRYSRTEPDWQATAAIRANLAMLDHLSAERVAHEYARILAAPNPMPGLHLMRDCGVMLRIFPEAVTDLEPLARMAEQDRNSGAEADVWLRFSLLLPQEPAVVAAVAERLRLSNAQTARLLALATLNEPMPEADDSAALNGLLYRIGNDRFRDLVRLAEARGALVDGVRLRGLADTYHRPMFPLKGTDVMAAGISAGPMVGGVLKEMEAWWAANGFRASRDELLARLRGRIVFVDPEEVQRPNMK